MDKLLAKQFADILLEHPDAYACELGGVITKDKIIWNDKNFYID